MSQSILSTNLFSQTFSDKIIRYSFQLFQYMKSTLSTAWWLNGVIYSVGPFISMDQIYLRNVFIFLHFVLKLFSGSPWKDFSFKYQCPSSPHCEKADLQHWICIPPTMGRVVAPQPLPTQQRHEPPGSVCPMQLLFLPVSSGLQLCKEFEPCLAITHRVVLTHVLPSNRSMSSLRTWTVYKELTEQFFSPSPGENWGTLKLVGDFLKGI